MDSILSAEQCILCCALFIQLELFTQPLSCYIITDIISYRTPFVHSVQENMNGMCVYHMRPQAKRDTNANH